MWCRSEAEEMQELVKREMESAATFTRADCG